MKRLFALMLISMMALVSCMEEEVEDVTTSISSVKLSKSSLSFWVGDDYTLLTTTVTPSDIDVESTIWSVSNDVPEGCVTVDNNGRVSPVAAGTATVTVTVTASVDGSKASADCQVTVGLVDATTITLSSDTLDLFKYDTHTLTASIKPVNASDYGVTWSIKEATPEGCIGLNTKGKVTGVTTGTAIVMAASETNPDVTAECYVTVTVMPELVELDYYTLTLSAAGYVNDIYPTSHQFIVTMTPDDVTDQSLVWLVENENDEGEVLSVDENGLLTALREGYGEVVVTSVADPTLYARCYVDVIVPADSIYISTTDFALATSEGAVTIEMGYSPSDASNKEVTWMLEALDDDGNVIEGEEVTCVEIEVYSATTIYVTAVVVDGFDYQDVTKVKLTAVYDSDTSLTASCIITVTNDIEVVADPDGGDE